MSQPLLRILRRRRGENLLCDSNTRAFCAKGVENFFSAKRRREGIQALSSAGGIAVLFGAEETGGRTEGGGGGRGRGGRRRQNLHKKSINPNAEWLGTRIKTFH